MPLIKQCCCCFNLKTGGVILGYLGMIGCIMRILSFSILLVNLDSILKSPQSVSGLSDDFAEPDFNPSPEMAAVGITHQVASMTLTFMITFSVIGLFAYLCLLIGSSRGNRYLLLPALILDMLIFVVSTLTSLAFMIIAFSGNAGVLGVAFMLGGLVVNGLMLYFWLCVLSLFQHLREIQNAASLFQWPHSLTLLILQYIDGTADDDEIEIYWWLCEFSLFQLLREAAETPVDTLETPAEMCGSIVKVTGTGEMHLIGMDSQHRLNSLNYELAAPILALANNNYKHFKFSLMIKIQITYGTNRTRKLDPSLAQVTRETSPTKKHDHTFTQVTHETSPTKKHDHTLAQVTRETSPTKKHEHTLTQVTRETSPTKKHDHTLTQVTRETSPTKKHDHTLTQVTRETSHTKKHDHTLAQVTRETSPTKKHDHTLTQTSPTKKHDHTLTQVTRETSPTKKHDHTLTQVTRETSPTKKHDHTLAQATRETSPTKKHDTTLAQVTRETSPTKKHDHTLTQVTRETSPTKKHDHTLTQVTRETSPTKKHDHTLTQVTRETSPTKKHDYTLTQVTRETSPTKKHDPAYPNGIEVPQRVVHTNDDGGCLFYTLSYAVFGTDSLGHELRYQIVDYISENWDRFQTFTMDNEGNNFVRKKTYCIEMSKLSTDGTTCKLKVVGQLYPLRFEVYQNGQLLVDFGEPGEGVRRLRFTGDLSGGHFDVYQAIEELPYLSQFIPHQPDTPSLQCPDNIPKKQGGKKRRARATNTIRNKQMSEAAAKCTKKSPIVNRAAVAAYSLKHPEVHRAAVAAYSLKHPEVHRVVMARNDPFHKKRQQRKNVPWSNKINSALSYNPDISYGNGNIK
uniref:OTU domain-containing protein n=1 Tax=Timema tahoe TaxID=61484 RepID=A0A7R9INL2_9NEOP|nr:unnamed protein product [Timema tahoe]